jgi:hypothetical protein
MTCLKQHRASGAEMKLPEKERKEEGRKAEAKNLGL